MNVFEALETRRSIRKFQSNEAIPQGDFDALLNAARLTASSFNIQHTRIVRVSDPALRMRIQDAAWGQEQVGGAQELLLFCADTQAWNKQPERYWRNVDTDKQTYIVNLLKEFYRDQPQRQHDEAIRSSALAAQSVMLACKSLGYDSNPMVGFDADAIAKLIHLPSDHIICLMLALGKAAETPHARGGAIELDELLITNTY